MRTATRTLSPFGEPVQIRRGLALCVGGIEGGQADCRRHADNSAAALTALVDRIGYKAAQQIIEAARAEGGTTREAAVTLGVLSAEEFDRLTSPENVLLPGSPDGFGEAMPQNAT